MRDVCSLICLALIGLFRSRASLEVEILTLRHQLNVLRRKSPQRLTFTSVDRLVFAGLYRLAPGVLDALKIVRPETVIRRHRAGFRAYWRWKSRPRSGRPKTSLEIRQLIREMSLANPLWGAPRIHGELLKLGIDVGQTTVGKYTARGKRPPSQGRKLHVDPVRSRIGLELREELAALQVEVNEEKGRIVDLGRGESFGFLGFDFRRIRSGRGVWRASFTPKLKKRTALLRKLKDVFRRHQSQPVDRVISLINPILRGWVNYFAVGHASECFGYIQDWVEKKIRRHLMRARKRKGFGWTRWSRQWLYETLKLFSNYKVRWLQPKVAPAG